MTANIPNTIDRHVGSRVRAQRIARDMTLENLAEALGVRVGDIQNYEAGVERIGAYRLNRIAGILGVPITFFFEASDGSGLDLDDLPRRPASPLSSDSQTADLAASFERIRPPQARRALLDFEHAVQDIEGEA